MFSSFYSTKSIFLAVFLISVIYLPSVLSSNVHKEAVQTHPIANPPSMDAIEPSQTLLDLLRDQIFSPECYYQFFNQRVFEETCVKETLNKALGVLVIAISMVLKFPQMLKILQSKSVAGISFLSIYIELYMYGLTLGYNIFHHYPLYMYGEMVFVYIQSIMVFILFWIYSEKQSNLKVMVMFVLFVVAQYGIFADMISEQVYHVSIFVNMGMNVLAKYPQIRLNYVNQSTGQLSFFMVSANTLKSTLRSITMLLDEKSHLTFTISMILGMILNWIVFLQAIVYWNNSVKPEISKKKTE
jgi:mannose-P-dolichol utilization defect protein 1